MSAGELLIDGRKIDISPFFLGLILGTLLWQSVGEDLWNFSVNGVNFVQFESGSILILLGIYLGVFSARDRKGRLIASIITYIATGIIAFGIMEG